MDQLRIGIVSQVDYARDCRVTCNDEGNSIDPLQVLSVPQNERQSCCNEAEAPYLEQVEHAPPLDFLAEEAIVERRRR